MFEFKASNIKVFNVDALEEIGELNLNDTIIATDLNESSLSKEELSFTHEASFEVDGIDLFSFPLYTTVIDKPFNLEYSIPAMIQARWHKRKRINKKWLKRYGMKKDNIRVKCNVNSISSDNSYNPYNLVESKKFDMELGDMQYQFRPDQLRRNLRIELTV